jgi:antitoxin CptB
MTHPVVVPDRLQGDPSSVRRKRLVFRCWHRGTQENDLVLGSFAEANLAVFNSAQLQRFEALLDCADADLFDWIAGRRVPPPQHDHDVMRLLRSFSYVQHRRAVSTPRTGESRRPRELRVRTNTTAQERE